MTDRPLLLALVNATAEWHAGLPHACHASVRLLDRVQLVVHRGDCVLIHHDDPSGARILLGVLAGHAALCAGHRLHGERQCAAGVRVRRCSIGTDVVDHIRRGWAEGVEPPASGITAAPGAAGAGPRAPVVHLLRASRTGPPTAPQDSRAVHWREWAARERDRGGALVIVAPPAPALARRPSVPGPRMATPQQAVGSIPVPSPASAATPTALRETAGPAYQPPPDPWPELRLHHGRLLDARVSPRTPETHTRPGSGTPGA